MSIHPLNFDNHKNILSNLNLYWGKKSEKVRDLHHHNFPLLFSDISLVKKINNTIVSYLYTLKTDDLFFIHMIATHAKYYRNGYARSLVSEIEKKANTMAIDSIQCYRLPTNRLSEIFFLNLGFKNTRKLEVAVGDYRILMEKKIKRW